MSPIQSTPASAQASASSTHVKPQIFTRDDGVRHAKVLRKNGADRTASKPMRFGLASEPGQPRAQETPSLSSSFSLNLFSPLTPTSLSTSLPSLKNTTVGIAEMRRPPGVS